MRKKRETRKEEAFSKEKIEKHKKRHPHGGVKKCLRCDKLFLSVDVSNNRICVDCARFISKEWTPNIHKSGINSGAEPDDWL